MNRDVHFWAGFQRVKPFGRHFSLEGVVGEDLSFYRKKRKVFPYNMEELCYKDFLRYPMRGRGIYACRLRSGLLSICL